MLLLFEFFLTIIFISSIISEFLDATDAKRQRAIRKVLSDVVQTNFSDILVVLSLNDPDAIKRFNTAARFWACVEVIKIKGINKRSAICDRFCLPTNSFDRYTQMSIGRLDAKRSKYLLPSHLFFAFNKNGIV